MNEVVDLTISSVFGLSGLVPLAGIVLAVRHRSSHPVAATFAVAGFGCVLADKLLFLGFSGLYPRIPGGSDATSAQRDAVDLGGLSLSYGVNVVGAIGWSLILVALFTEVGRLQTVDQHHVGGVR